SKLLVGLLQLLLLNLQFGGELLRLLQEALRLHGGFDGVEHNADAGGELLEESEVRRGERAERSKLDDGFHAALEEHRKHDDIARDGFEQTGANGNAVERQISDKQTALFHSALSDEAFAEREIFAMAVFAVIGIGREQNHLLGVFRLHAIDDDLLRINEWREFREQQTPDSREIALALQHTGESSEVGFQPVLLGVAVGGEAQIVNHRVDVVFEFSNFAARLNLNRARQVALGHGGGDFGNRAHLVGEVIGEQVDVAGEVLPRSCGARDVGLAAETPFHSDFAGHGGDLISEDGECAGHVIDGVGERGNFALRVHREFLPEIAVRHSGDDFHDAAHLFSEVRGHDVDVISEVFPCSGDSRHDRLAAEFSVGADFASHAGDFRREGIELVDHGVDSVLQFENFALHVHGDFAREIAARHGGGHFCDVTHLASEVAGHRVHRIGQVFPRAADSGNIGLAAKAAFGTDFASHARDFGGERAKLVDHRVDRVFQQQNFAANVHGDFLGEVAAGDCRGDFGNVADLRGEVAGHGVDRVGKIFPRPADSGDLCLAAKLSVGADFARNAGDFRRERAKLIHHGVKRVFKFEDFALHVHGDFAREVAARHGGGDFGDVTDLASEVASHEVDVVGEVFPRAADSGHNRLAT